MKADEETNGQQEACANVQPSSTVSDKYANNEATSNPTKAAQTTDPKATYEAYLKAKSDGDVGEASKCFASIFCDLFARSQKDTDPMQGKTSESLVVINQTKEEIRLLLSELKSHYLKLKSSLMMNSIGGGLRQTSSVCTSPMLSPRVRMSSEDRTASRESLTKLDSQLRSTSKSFFYQQMFDNLSHHVRLDLLTHSIDACDNLLEKCRLMMLSITLFNETVANHAKQLIATLVGLTDETGKAATNVRPIVTLRQQAKSLLILDAIPLVLNLKDVELAQVDLDQLFERTIKFYSEHYVQNAANEYEPQELHEGLKKSVAARILGREIQSTLDESMEENILSTLIALSERYLKEVIADDGNLKEKLHDLRCAVANRQSKTTATFERVLEVIETIGLDDEIPENVLLSDTEHVNPPSVPVPVTPPPKGRGRPKKVQASVIVNPDEGMRKQQKAKAKVARFVFFSIMQHLLVNATQYFKQTRSRILMKFSIPPQLMASLDTIPKGSTARPSRGSSQTKKVKVEVKEVGSANIQSQKSSEPSPLESDESRRIDEAILKALNELRKCYEYLSRDSNRPICVLWRQIPKRLALNEQNWFKRMLIDLNILLGQYSEALDSLKPVLEPKVDCEGIVVKREQIDAETSTSTIMAGPSPITTVQLRFLVQAVACSIQLADKVVVFRNIEELLRRMRQVGLLANDENYSTGNILDDYMVLIGPQQDHLGFLFFDALSVIRYTVDTLMHSLRPQATSLSPTADSLVGHIIVMSQFDWPRELPIYEHCILWLRENKPKSTTPQCLSASTKFTYSEFFQHIFNPNIIEDFMALLNQGYTLDIKSAACPAQGTGNRSHNSSGSSTRSGKAITTRGVNKTFKEDLKIALIAQMKVSSILIPLDTISNFIQSTLIPFLAG